MNVENLVAFVIGTICVVLLFLMWFPDPEDEEDEDA